MKSSWLLYLLLPALVLPAGAFAQSGNKMANRAKPGGIKIINERQVGKDGASTKFAFFSVSPESPDGKNILYLRLKKEPNVNERAVQLPGELWICDRDLKKHRKVTDIKGMYSEDGCFQQWLNNTQVALLDSGVVRVIDVRNGRDLLKKRVTTRFLGHDSHEGRILFTIAESKGAEKAGIYELNCFTEEIKPVLLNEDCEGAILPSFLDPKSILPVAKWRMLHCQYSPDGRKICFRVDTGPTDKYQLLGLCNVDGSDFKVQAKALHHMWYDNESIMGHARFDEKGEGLPMDKRFRLMRWDLNGKYIETMGPLGNHLGASPNRDLFASETMYYKSPVIVTLYPKGKAEQGVEVANFDPYELTWNKFFHVNPTFSRDGKRLYYCRPINQQYSGTFVCDIKTD